MTAPVDPGWGAAVRQLPRMLVPTRGMRFAASSTNGLTVMRTMWVTFAVAMVLMGAVVVLIDSIAPGGGADGRVVAAVIVVLGVFLQVVSVKFVPEVSGSTEREVRETAQRAFFVRVAFAEPVALIGFLGFVLTGNVAVYLVGAVIGLAGMLDTAPTRRWIEQHRRVLTESGSRVDFLAAVTGDGITR